MKKTKTLYWIFTGLFALAMTGTAIPNIIMDDQTVKAIHNDMGYPLYFIPFIGVAKLLGVVGILVPRFPRLKEFAYAGLLFDLVAVVYTLAAIGATAGDFLFLSVFLLLWVLSYTLYHRLRKEGNTEKSYAARGVADVAV